MRSVDSRLERLNAINLEIRDVRNLILSGEDGDRCLRSLDCSELIFSGAVLASESVENIGDFLGGDLSESLSVVQHIIDKLMVVVGDSQRLDDDALCAYLSEEAAKKATRVAIDNGCMDSSESFAPSEFDFLFLKI